MTFEHFALNVKVPVKMAQWYTENCGMKIVRTIEDGHSTRFLADEQGNTIMELYSNDKAIYWDFVNYHPLSFHFALKVNNAESIKAKLTEAGATLEEDLKLEDGSHLVMLRDPFGIPLQICQRSIPLT